MKNEFTTEQLINAIREATDLRDLKRLVGPSTEEQLLGAQRVKAIDECFERYVLAYGEAISQWPDHARDHYYRLSAEQDAFENLYF